MTTLKINEDEDGQETGPEVRWQQAKCESEQARLRTFLSCSRFHLYENFNLTLQELYCCKCWFIIGDT